MLMMLMDGGGLYLPPPLAPLKLTKGTFVLLGANFLHAGQAYPNADNVRAFAYVTTQEFADKLDSFNVTDTERGKLYLRQPKLDTEDEEEDEE